MSIPLFLCFDLNFTSFLYKNIISLHCLFLSPFVFLITEGAKVRHDGSSTCVDIYVSHCDKLESVSDDAFLGVHLCYVSACLIQLK